MTPDDAQGTPEPTQIAEPVASPDAEATQSQTAEGTPAPEPEAESEWTPDSLPRDAQGRFSKWVEKEKATYLRQEQTRNGNKLMGVPDDDKEKLRKDPLYVRRIEAQLEEARRHVGSQVVGPTGGVQKPEVDDAEQDAKAFLQSEGWTGEEDGYKAMLRHETARIKFLDKRLEKRAPKFDADKATNEVAGKLTQRQVEEELAEVYRSPEWNDEEKGAAFEGFFRRMATKCVEEGKKFSPRQIAEEAKKKVFPAAAAASKPKPKPSFGDSSSGKVSAAAESDPLEEYNKRLRASGVDPKTW